MPTVEKVIPQTGEEDCDIIQKLYMARINSSGSATAMSVRIGLRPQFPTKPNVTEIGIERSFSQGSLPTC